MEQTVFVASMMAVLGLVRLVTQLASVRQARMTHTLFSCVGLKRLFGHNTFPFCLEHRTGLGWFQAHTKNPSPPLQRHA